MVERHLETRASVVEHVLGVIWVDHSMRGVLEDNLVRGGEGCEEWWVVKGRGGWEGRGGDGGE